MNLLILPYGPLSCKPRCEVFIVATLSCEHITDMELTNIRLAQVRAVYNPSSYHLVTTIGC